MGLLRLGRRRSRRCCLSLQSCCPNTWARSPLAESPASVFAPNPRLPIWGRPHTPLWAPNGGLTRDTSRFRPISSACAATGADRQSRSFTLQNLTGPTRTLSPARVALIGRNSTDPSPASSGGTCPAPYAAITWTTEPTWTWDPFPAWPHRECPTLSWRAWARPPDNANPSPPGKPDGDGSLAHPALSPRGACATNGPPNSPS